MLSSESPSYFSFRSLCLSLFSSSLCPLLQSITSRGRMLLSWANLEWRQQVLLPLWATSPPPFLCSEREGWGLLYNEAQESHPEKDREFVKDLVNDNEWCHVILIRMTDEDLHYSARVEFDNVWSKKGVKGINATASPPRHCACTFSPQLVLHQCLKKSPVFPHIQPPP